MIMSFFSKSPSFWKRPYLPINVKRPCTFNDFPVKMGRWMINAPMNNNIATRNNINTDKNDSSNKKLKYNSADYFKSRKISPNFSKAIARYF